MNIFTQFVPIYVVIAKPIILSALIAIVANLAFMPDKKQSLRNTTLRWNVIVILLCLWLFGDLLFDLVTRFSGSSSSISNGYVDFIRSLGGVYIFIVTAIAVFGKIRHNKSFIIFAIIMLATMALQVSQISVWTNIAIADAILSYIQQGIVIFAVTTVRNYSTQQ